MAAAFPAFHVGIPLVVSVVVLEGGYILANRRFAPQGRRPSGGQWFAWTAGVALVWLAIGWPLDDLSDHYLFSAHMLQHTVLTLMVPPLLLIGTPDWLARGVLRPRPMFAVARRLCRPIPALLLFNAFTVFAHWPLIMDYTLRNDAFHFAIHALWVLTALFMWMPVLSPLTEIPRLPPPAQMLYLFVQSLIPTVAASFLTFSNGVI